MIINPYIYGVAASYDPDAQLFFNAQTGAGVTLTTTQKDAVNQWVIDAKAIGIWTKFKAVYPVVGGTATSHKFNLKNPLDTNAAFRLAFAGGGTHSSNGYQPNGTNAYADTFLNPLFQNSTHLSYYSRTNAVGGGDIGNWASYTAGTPAYLYIKAASGNTAFRLNATGTESNIARADSRGFAVISRRLSTTQSLFFNNVKTDFTITSTGVPTGNITIGAVSFGTFDYGSKQCAFASIGDGLTDLESQLFYQITEKYQVALSRNINALQSFYYNSSYNNETNAFLFSTQITDNTIQTATDTLVTDLKTAGVFTKMKALYPMVGGTATTHKFNLINSQDTNAAFRLSFVGGWTHSANGALPNGVNAYGDTFFAPNIETDGTSHYSFYSRTNVAASAVVFGSNSVGPNYYYTTLNPRNLSNQCVNAINENTGEVFPNSSSLGLFTLNRQSANDYDVWVNSTKQINTTKLALGRSAFKIYLGALNGAGTASNFSTNECAFFTAGLPLTDAEALALYNAVQTFNTTLARQV